MRNRERPSDCLGLGWDDEVAWVCREACIDQRLAIGRLRFWLVMSQVESMFAAPLGIVCISNLFPSAIVR